MGDQAVAERQPWDRQPNETGWDFARFRRYRDQGPARSIPNAVRAWLADERPVRIQQRRYREILTSGGDSDDYVRRVTHTWWKISGKWAWIERVRAFDEMVEHEARGQAVVEHVEEELRFLKLRLIEARLLRRGGRMIWQRFLALVDEGKLDELLLERLKHVLISPAEEGRTSRVEREARGILELLTTGQEAIAEGQRLERLELGEAPDRIADEDLMEEPTERLRRGRDRLRELLGDDDTDS